MKRLVLVYAVLMAAAADAQLYTVQVQNSTYQELTGATTLVYEPSSQGYYFSAPMHFPVMGNTVDFNEVLSVPSRGAYVTRQGYLAIYDYPGYANTVVLHVFFNQNLVWYDSASQVSKVLEGTPGNRIIKVQWKNLGVTGAPTDYLNFQVWFHEADNSISYHFGPSSLTQQIGGYSQFFMMDNSFTTMKGNFSLYGSSAAPGDSSGANGFSQLPYLTDVPVNGTVYRFMPLTTGITQLRQTDFQVFPQPASGYIQVNLPAHSTPMHVQVLDVCGKEVLAADSEKAAITLNLATLPSGTYVLQVSSAAGVQRKRIIHTN